MEEAGKVGRVLTDHGRMLKVLEVGAGEYQDVIQVLKVWLWQLFGK